MELNLGSPIHQKNRNLDSYFYVSYIYFVINKFYAIYRNFVPISLIVTLELVKFWQGSFMGYDLMMYDSDQDFAMRAQTTNINEELGQIEYIFSDKTGTLTCNIMEFIKFSSKAGSFNFTETAKVNVSD